MRFLLLMALGSVATTLAHLPRASAQTQCDPARVMVLFDRSTSMNHTLLGDSSGKTKWQLAKEAVKDVLFTQEFEQRAEFGLAIFPKKDFDCTEGADVAGALQPTLGSWSQAQTMLAKSPSGAAWTPLGQSLVQMETFAPLQDPQKRRYVILFTDGAQSCPNGNYSVGAVYQKEAQEVPWTTVPPGGEHPLAVQVARLRARGIKTFVVGFGRNSSGGDAVDAYALNRMAWAAGTARPGCDPSGTSVTSPNLCYYQANTPEELPAMLEEIAIQISEETCDGLDNDCDGRIDEDLSMQCSTACGVGTQTCQLGDWGMCSAPQPEVEICDGIDNDCDGIIDEGCACVHGERRPCGSSVGECALGEEVCVNGAWGPCQGGRGPTGETCDGLDNDCDGIVDPGCECRDGEVRSCGGPDVAPCRSGTQTCVAGAWGACVGSIGPSPERCDGVDNNCDGVIDEGCACRDGEREPCGSSEGECEPGERICVEGQWGACVVVQGPVEEICDGLDNDCDGVIDPDCECRHGAERSCGGPDVGQCRSGTQRCVAGAWGDCLGAIGPSTEVCDGIDNNCNGVVDEPAGLGDDDDLSASLCSATEVCRDGACVATAPPEPVVGVVPAPAGDVAGCGCRAAGGPAGGGPLGGLLLAAGLIASRLTRRRRPR
jgi:MYXO-CTERM domain-containing protein